MNFTLTARHFKAHDSLKEFAEAQADKITKFYDGVIRTEIILSYEKAQNSLKICEVIAKAAPLHVFTAKEQSDDFLVSIEAAVNKVTTQIKKYKDKMKPNHNSHEKVVDHLADGE